MEIDADDMKLESLEIKIVAAREPGHNLPLQELILTFSWPVTLLSTREDRDSDPSIVFSGNLTKKSIQKALKTAENLLVSDVLEITAEAKFLRQYIGRLDETYVLFHNFRYDSKLDFLTAFITLEDDGNKTWKPDLDFTLTPEEFSSIDLVSSMVERIDEVGIALGFPTNIFDKSLQITAFRSVPPSL